MKPLVILYATREGQARRVAEHLAQEVRKHGLAVHVENVRALPPSFHPSAYRAALLVASVHFGNHEREMVRFARRYGADLSRLPNALLSVSGSQATAEDPTVPAAVRADAARKARAAVDRFVKAAGWTPARSKLVAGALLYTQYGAFWRFLIRQVAKRSGTTIDISRDREYTDWRDLDRFAEEWCAEGPLQRRADPPFQDGLPPERELGGAKTPRQMRPVSRWSISR